MTKSNQIEIRKERNKHAAAKSRANRKASIEKMQETIEQLRLENAALQVQLNYYIAQSMGAPQEIDSHVWLEQMIASSAPPVQVTTTEYEESTTLMSSVDLLNQSL